MGFLNDMSLEMQIAIAAGIVFTAIAAIVLRFVYKKIPRRLRQKRFQKRWSELQALCKTPETWPEAVQKADKLFDDALKQRSFKGKKMGERIVSAQRKLSDNDSVWFAHNLAKRTVEKPEKALQEKEVKQALVSFRQALRDLGALPNDKK